MQPPHMQCLRTCRQKGQRRPTPALIDMDNSPPSVHPSDALVVGVDVAAFDARYAEYQRLHDDFGRGENTVMQVLCNLRRTAFVQAPADREVLV